MTIKDLCWGTMGSCFGILDEVIYRFINSACNFVLLIYICDLVAKAANEEGCECHSFDIVILL